MTATSDNDDLIADLDQAIADTVQRLNDDLEQEGAELERQLCAYVNKMEARFGASRATLHICVNTWFEEHTPLRIQWITNGNSLSGNSIYDVGAVCLQAAPRTLLFKNSREGTCPTLVDGKVEWK